MGSTSPRSTWDHLTYPIPCNEIGAELHPFQAYILKMAALDYVHRPPPLTESGEEANFYLGFEDQHDLLLSWVLDSGFSEPIHPLRKNDNNRILFERHPLAVVVLDTALEVSVTQSTIRRFSERPLPLPLAQYAESNSAGLSGFRMNVLWTAAERYAEMMIEDAACGGDERHVIGENTFFDRVTQERRPKDAVYIQDVNLATFCAINAEFEKYVFNKESSCGWWWDEESHADKIRELLKHTIRLALDMACKAKGVELVIYPSTVAASDGDSCELEDSCLEEEDLYLEDEESPEDKGSTAEHTTDHEMQDITAEARMGYKTQDSDSDSDTESMYGCCPRARSRSPAYSPRDGPPHEDPENEPDREKSDAQYFEDFTGTTFITANTIQPSDLNRGWKPYQPPVPTRNIMVNGKWLCVEVPERKLSPTITDDMLQDYPKRVQLGHLSEKQGGSFGRPERRRQNLTESEIDKHIEEAAKPIEKAAEKPKVPKKIKKKGWKAVRRAQKAMKAKGKEDKAKQEAGEAEAWDYSGGEVPENLAEYFRDAENGDIERAAATGVAEGGGAQNENGGARRIWLRGRAPGEEDGRALAYPKVVNHELSE